MQVTVLSMQRDRVWDSATRRVRAVPSPDGSRGKRRTSFDEVFVVVCFLALIAVVVLGGAVMLLSWVTATLPVSSRIACPELNGCVWGSDENEAVLVDDHPTDGPMLTR
jgi:hypothetical protein